MLFTNHGKHASQKIYKSLFRSNTMLRAIHHPKPIASKGRPSSTQNGKNVFYSDLAISNIWIAVSIPTRVKIFIHIPEQHLHLAAVNFYTDNDHYFDMLAYVAGRFEHFPREKQLPLMSHPFYNTSGTRGKQS